MSATQIPMSDFMNEKWKAVVRAEKARLKNHLRHAIITKNYSFVYHFCVSAHPRYVKSVTDTVVLGQGQCLVDDQFVLWVNRYFRRLTGQDLW